MEFNIFRKMVINELSLILDECYEVVAQDTVKMNSVTYQGICIREKDSMIAPVIYLEELYDGFLRDDLSIGDVVELVLKKKESETLKKEILDKHQLLFDWKQARNNIKPLLINTEKNKSMLKNVPNVPFLDLSICFYLELELEDEVASVTITNQIMEAYDVDVQMLNKQAMINLGNIRVCFNGILETMLGLDAPEDMLEEVMLEDNTNMYVLTNCSYSYGAAAILLPKVRKMIVSKLNGQAFLLPSSIFEWIVIPTEKYQSVKSLREMVAEINETVLGEKDFLSNNVYLLNNQAELELIE